MKNTLLLCASLCLIGTAFAGRALGTEKVFDWRPANDESVRLDPANYHSGRTYHPGPNGGNMHVDIHSQQPVTIFLADAGEWSAALQHPESIDRVRQVCLREHVVDTTFVCDLPAEPMTLVIQDERPGPHPGVFAGLGVVLDGQEKLTQSVGLKIFTDLKARTAPQHQFVSPNDVHVQYYSWTCVENCVQPEFQWQYQVQEKYNLTPLLKVYGGFVPDYDGERVSIRIKSPVPMLVAMLPSQVADRLYGQPGQLQPALENNSCQQRAVQSQQFECTFNVSDGPQSLIAVPESTNSVPHKKAEIEMQADKCVANCLESSDAR